MDIVFCNDPLSRMRVDDVYELEAVAAKSIGFGTELISYETLVNESNPGGAVRRVSARHGAERGLYRGWMLRPSQYGQLYNALMEKGIELINTPEEYAHCHFLPESYPDIEGMTPKSTWLRWSSGVQSYDDVMEALRPFGDRPVIVKDFVKSKKHYWHEACYIPSASDRREVERVVRRFLELQGDALNEGLVFREYLELEPLLTHSKSGMPLSREYRLFVLDKQVLACVNYWEEGDYGAVALPLEEFAPAIERIGSRFFTMDVARLKDGRWTILELGDGQVAGLPDALDPNVFYSALHARLFG